jgi:unsaturated rhamnogalacturonyl hydrolase
MRIKKVFMSAAVALFVQCLSAQQQTKSNYSTLLAESVIKNNPQVWTTDFQKTPKWGYVEGLVCLSLQQLS